MAVLEICCLPDPVLRRKARRVPSIDGSIQQLIDNMIDTMQHTHGVGLAAPQIGVSLQVVVLQMPDEEPFAIVNPEIVKRSGEQQVMEGCLSVPGYVGEFKRSAAVTVKGLDRNGKAMRVKATGLLAEALEHEIDHLKGVVYIDHLDAVDRLHRVE